MKNLIEDLTSKNESLTKQLSQKDQEVSLFKNLKSIFEIKSICVQIVKESNEKHAR